MVMTPQDFHRAKSPPNIVAPRTTPTNHRKLAIGTHEDQNGVPSQEVPLSQTGYEKE